MELPTVEEPLERKQDRAARFTKLARVDQDLKHLATFRPVEAVTVPAVAVELGAPQAPLEGRSRALERGYLRDAAKLRDPAHIRPVPVLKEALAHALQAKRPWAWEAEMLRAIRQDLTVQQADAEFMEEVYEISALRALENSDWPTFAACAPGVRNRPRAAELAWLLLLGGSTFARARLLQQSPEPESATAKYVRMVLSDMSTGRLSKALKRESPTEAAKLAHGIIVKPITSAQIFAAATKAFPKVRVDTLQCLGIDQLPDGVDAIQGVLDGRRAHAQAQLQVEAAQKPAQRQDHSAEFLR